MSGFLAIARREIADRRSVLGAALVAAAIPLLLPIVPGLFTAPATDLRGALAWCMALALTSVVAAFLGSSMVAGPLAQGRLGFYFARPVSGVAIWSAKTAATLVLVLLCEILVLAPAAVLPGSRSYFDLGAESQWWLVALLVGAPLLLILSAHAIGIMFRARSAWLALDAAAFLILVLAWWYLLSPWLLLAPDVLIACAISLFLALIVALGAAGAVQMAVGRTDLARGHRALSSTLWAVLGAATLALAGYSAWLWSAEPKDITRADVVVAAPRGPWVAVGGPCAARLDYRPMFLVDLNSGRHLRISAGLYHGWTSVAFSNDGGTSVWLAPGGTRSWQLMVADLRAEEPLVRATDMFFNEWPDLELSASGQRLAVSEGHSLSVYDLESSRLLAAVRIDDFPSHFRFVADDLVRVIVRAAEASDPAKVKILELDVGARELRPTGSIVELAAPALVLLDRQWDRLLLGQRGERGLRWTLCDGRSGERSASVDAFEGRGWPLFLDDGRLVRTSIPDDGTVLVEWSEADGAPLTSVPVAAGSRALLGGEPTPGSVVVSVHAGDDQGFSLEGWSSYLVNLESGHSEEIPGVGLASRWHHRSFYSAWQERILARLFLAPDWSLVLWDPESGATRTIVRAR